MKHIFLVEDELSLKNLLVSYLVESGYEVTSFNNGVDAKNAIDQSPDLWVLDIMLPGIDGYELIKHIKEHNSETPVIFMSARNAELDRVLGLEMGSDDYLAKPFLPRELVLRVNRILKSSSTKKSDLLDVGNYRFDRKRRVLTYLTQEFPLTVKEYDLFEYLVEHIGKAVSRSELIDSVWGEDYFGSDKVVDDTLRRLRKKVPDLPIENIYGFGFILNS